jgi:hypothetical protein
MWTSASGGITTLCANVATGAFGSVRSGQIEPSAPFVPAVVSPTSDA